MATPAFVRDHVAESVKSAGTTDTYATTAIVAAGNLLVMALVHDNAAAANTPTVAGTPPISKPASETASWVFLGRATYPNAATAGAFANGELWAIKTTVAWPNATSLTVTYSNSITMKAQNILEFSNAEAVLRSTVGTAYSTTTTAASAATTGTTPLVNDLAIGLAFGSNVAAVQAGDTDTTGGAWSARSSLGSTGGNATTNNFGYTQYKVLTAASHQTFNNSAAMTAGNGVVVAILQASPDPVISQAAYRFYADGPEAFVSPLAAQDTAITLDVFSGDKDLTLRTRLQETNVGSVPATSDFQLQYEKNLSGTWTNVTTTSTNVKAFASTNLTDGGATTQRTTGGTGTFEAGQVSETGLVLNEGWAKANYTELVYTLRLVSANLANGETLRFRVLDDGVPVSTYAVTPTINVTVTPPTPKTAFDSGTFSATDSAVQSVYIPPPEPTVEFWTRVEELSPTLVVSTGAWSANAEDMVYFISADDAAFANTNSIAYSSNVSGMTPLMATTSGTRAYYGIVSTPGPVTITAGVDSGYIFNGWLFIIRGADVTTAPQLQYNPLLFFDNPGMYDVTNFDFGLEIVFSRDDGGSTVGPIFTNYGTLTSLGVHTASYEFNWAKVGNRPLAGTNYQNVLSGYFQSNTQIFGVEFKPAPVTGGGPTPVVGTDTGTFSATETASVVASGAIPKAGSDTGTFSATETASVSISNFLSRTDTGTISATETSSKTVLVNGTYRTHGTYQEHLTYRSQVPLPTTKSGTDTGTFSATESAAVTVTVSRTDTGTFSATEARTILSSSARTDTGTFSAADTSSSQSTLARTDTGTFSVTDTSSSASTLSRTDTGTFSATDTSSLGGSTTLPGADTGTFSAIDTSSVAVFSSSVDSGSLSAIEVSSNQSSLTRTDTGTVSATENSDDDSALSRADAGTLSATDVSSLFVNNALAATDTGTFSATETASLFINNALNVTDTGIFSVTDVSASAGTLSRADTGTLSATEVSTNLSTLTASDTGSLSGTESVTQANTIGLTDTGTFSVTEAVAVRVSRDLTDTGTFSVVDTVAGASTGVASDTGTISATDTANLIVSFSTTDSGTLSATDTSSIVVSGGLSKAASDTGTFSVTESATIQTTQSIAVTDTGAFSATEARQIASSASVTDSGIFMGIETSASALSSSRTDAGTFSATDGATVFNDRPGADTGTFSVTEISSVAISGVVSKSANDTGTISATDSVTQRAAFVPTSDTGTLSATEALALAGASTRTDAGTISATDQATTFRPIAVADSGTFSSTDTINRVIFYGVTVKVWTSGGYAEGVIHVWAGDTMVVPPIHYWDGSAMEDVT